MMMGSRMTIDFPTARFLILVGGEVLNDETLDVRYTYLR